MSAIEANGFSQKEGSPCILEPQVLTHPAKAWLDNWPWGLVDRSKEFKGNLLGCTSEAICFQIQGELLDQLGLCSSYS